MQLVKAFARESGLGGYPKPDRVQGFLIEKAEFQSAALSQYWGYLGIVEKEMETTVLCKGEYRGYMPRNKIVYIWMFRKCRGPLLGFHITSVKQFWFLELGASLFVHLFFGVGREGKG